ncbi:hypothetical protein KQX54_007783 [Cotesia glomerata]|uniref:Uncharacterized protein n=1 Tax=Cotesia glomerata TaxID=32391 RepID=A0AAV7IWU1_COTGL|nr:hypothetical protein KQX54_007783 [Cotesia glomerata]
MEDSRKEYCLVAAGEKKLIIKTKYVFKIDSTNSLVPITLEEAKDVLVCVRRKSLALDDLTLVDSDDNAVVLKARNTGTSSHVDTNQMEKSAQIPSAQVNDNTQNATPGDSNDDFEDSQNEITGLSVEQEESAELLSHEMNGIPLSPPIPSYSDTGHSLRRLIYSSNQRNHRTETSGSSGQLKPNVDEYPLLKDVIEMENGVAMRTIGNLKIENGKLGDILVKDTLRRRADCLMHALWPDDQMKRMYVKVPADAVDAVVPTSVDRQNIEDVCLFLQRKREIQYFDGGIDDIKVWLKKWMSELFNQTRSKLKRKLKAQQAAE